MSATVLVIACGALARELVVVTRQRGWRHVRICCLPAALHNTPQKIPAAVTALIEASRDGYEHIFVAYADCGTAGALDRALAAYQVERLPGAHCYEVFAGSAGFAGLGDAEPGTFYLTDFLVRHFDRLVIRGLGLHRHPELKEEYFRHYRRVVHLAQSGSEELARLARAHAAYLGLEFTPRFTGLEAVSRALEEHVVRWQGDRALSVRAAVAAPRAR
jgi:hypothetical protein